MSDLPKQVFAVSASLPGIEGLVNAFFCSNSWVLSESENGEVTGKNMITGRSLEELDAAVVKSIVRSKPIYRFMEA